MGQLKSGLLLAVNGSTTVYGNLFADWSSISAGDWVAFKDTGIVLEVVSTALLPHSSATAYDASTSYSAGDRVRLGNRQYISARSSNRGNTPSEQSLAWMETLGWTAVLESAYTGDTKENLPYGISTDFTGDQTLPRLEADDYEQFAILKKAIQRIDESISSAGTTPTTDPTLSSNSDVLIPSVSAVRAYVDSKTPAPEEEAPTGNALLRGGAVVPISNLGVRVGATSYMIQGTTYNIVQQDLTATAADGANPRIDAVVVNSSGAAAIVAGTPAANPNRPVIDPTTQLELTFIYIPAAATEITSNVEQVYQENSGGSWTASQTGGHVTLASTNNPLAGTICIEATAMVAGDTILFTRSSSIDITTFDQLVLNIRPKTTTTWPSTKQLNVTVRLAGVQKGNAIVIKNATFNFNTATGAYQLVVPSTSAFGTAGVLIDQILLTAAGGGASFGFYLDEISLQGGVAPSADATRMRWRGAHSSTLYYNTNDVVLSENIQYVCIAGHINKTPASNLLTFWQATTGAVSSGISQTSKSAAYTLVLADANTTIFHPAADTTARIWTIPANASVAFPIGTTVTFVNETLGGVITIAITSDTLLWAGAGSTGSRTLAASGIATALKITSTKWIINGTGLS